jgi:hypothetical protein
LAAKKFAIEVITKIKIKNQNQYCKFNRKMENINKNGGKLSFMVIVTICLPQMCLSTLGAALATICNYLATRLLKGT